MSEDLNYRVGDLLIDVGRGRLMRGDTEIALGKLSYDLLLVLIRSAPNLLSPDTLIERVWPGVVVSPETVNQRVKLLRDALGDDPKAPRYIAGLRGRGYQLIAPVEAVPVPFARPLVAQGPACAVQSPVPELAAPPPDPAPSTTAAPDLPALPAGRHFGPKTYATAALVLLALGAIGYFMLAGERARKTSVLITGIPAFAPPPRSVAVLAFMNLSGEAKDEYFSDGLAEEVVHALTRINQLHVAARTSSFSFKGAHVDIPTVGRQLNVGTVLEGSVRKSGSQVRITTQLIDARNGYHLWSQTYDRELTDALALQTEIATAVAGILKVTVLADTKKNLATGGTSNPAAFEAYLRARHGESLQDEAGLRASIGALDEAIEIDPRYANAYAFRGNVLAQLANEWVDDAKERQRLNAGAMASAEKAVALAPRSGDVHAGYAHVLMNSGNAVRRIDAELRKAIALEPGNASLLLAYASSAGMLGRPDALAAARRVVGLDPLSMAAQANLGVVLYYARRHDEARKAFHEAARLGRNRLTVNWTGVNELAAGKPAAALPYCTDPDFWYDQVCLAIAYQQVNRTRDALAMLERLQKSQGEGGAFQYAEIYAMWGQREQALKWLEKAQQLEDAGLSVIKTDPFLDSIRDSPRFQAVAAKVDLPS